MTMTCLPRHRRFRPTSNETGTVFGETGTVADLSVTLAAVRDDFRRITRAELLASKAGNANVREYTPYQPALDAGIPEEWDRKNARRIELIKQESRGQLSPEEQAEFEELQESVLAYFEQKFDRPIDIDDRIERLEQRYGLGKYSQ